MTSSRQLPASRNTVRRHADCLQCDILRPGRLPAVLVGDGRLGGISATIAAVEVDISADTLSLSGAQCDAAQAHPVQVCRALRGMVK
jgi:hypothetical protein